MSLNNYHTIPQLIKKIEENSSKLEQGSLTVNELNDMLEYSRAIHERIAILRYKALTKEQQPVVNETPAPTPIKAITEQSLFNEISTKKEKIIEEKESKEPSGFSLNFEVEKEEKEVKPTQKDLVNEIHDKSVNEQLSAQKQVSVAEKLQKSKIDDLRKVIGLNQKFLFMNDLFEGEKAHYDYALNHLNELHTLEEANNFLINDLAAKHSWDINSDTAKNFKELVERKFS